MFLGLEKPFTTCSSPQTTATTSTSAPPAAAVTVAMSSALDRWHCCCLEQQRKAAIALNNQAVTLLTRGCVQGALVTLQDAISVMRNTTAMMESSSSRRIVPTLIGKAEINAMLQRACRRMANSTSTTLASTTVVARSNLHVISSLDNAARVYNALTSCTDLSVAFPVTINPMEGIDFGETNDRIKYTLAFESAIVLFNYGLAHECAAAAAAARGDALTASNNRQRRVYRIFQMASAILYKVGRCHEETRGWNSTFSSSAMQLLLLRLVLTHARLDVSIALNLAQDYEVCNADMQDLLQMVEFQKRWLPSLDDSALAAAA